MPLIEMYERPGFLLRRAHQISAAIFEGSCAALGLTQAQYGALTVLSLQPGIDQTRLAKALAFDKVTVLRVVRGLEERGLIAREVSPNSRRQMAVRLTPAGIRLLKKPKALCKRPTTDSWPHWMHRRESNSSPCCSCSPMDWSTKRVQHLCLSRASLQRTELKKSLTKRHCAGTLSAGA